VTLPAWVGKQPGFMSAQQAPPNVSLGWRVLPYETYSCIEPPAGPSVTAEDDAQIREFDPDIIWCWRKQCYVSLDDPNQVQMSTHLCAARYEERPGRFGRRRMFHVEMPDDPSHPEPNVLDYVFEYVNMKDGGPGRHIAPQRIRHILRAKYVSDLVDAGRALGEADRVSSEKRAAEAEATWAEMEYRKEALRRNLQPIIDRLAPSDWAEYHHRLKPAARGRKREYAFTGH